MLLQHLSNLSLHFYFWAFVSISTAIASLKKLCNSVLYPCVSTPPLSLPLTLSPWNHKSDCISPLIKYSQWFPHDLQEIYFLIMVSNVFHGLSDLNSVFQFLLLYLLKCDVFCCHKHTYFPLKLNIYFYSPRPLGHQWFVSLSPSVKILFISQGSGPTEIF